MNNNSVLNRWMVKKNISFYDSVLSNWPVAYETRTVPTQQGDTFVIASGNENTPSLILLHGAASNSASWFGDVLEYSRHFRVYAIDIPGEPGKSAEKQTFISNVKVCRMVK
jgi:pimeloyl-ACP methyl ester carboxylesterase